MNHVCGQRRLDIALLSILLFAAILGTGLIARADEPYARTRDYDLKNIRTHLWFDVEQRGIRGEVTESISVLQNGITQIRLDSVDLKIESVALDGQEAKFSVTPTALVISLGHPGKRDERHEILVRYSGHPQKGIYFILPDKNYPQQAQEVWTQGEAEDTRYYIPTYDYPNDRTASEMLLTVPAKWTTVSNGKLIGVKDESDGLRTWDWKQSEPLSTYLISAIAGEFDEKDDSWHGIPLRYLVPRGEANKIDPTFSRTKEMLDLFSEKLGVPYPWAQYAQSTVDDFIEGGMENTSATTLSTRELVNPALEHEYRVGADLVNSHELAHQWFGDLVTCKDWANLWLNEGFATYFEHYWMEQHYGADEASYEFWREQREWFRQKRIYSVPIVTRDFDDSTKYEGNIYTKAGWVLRMLRAQLGDDNFFHALHDYLETNRGQNVVTADLQKAIEKATSVNVDKFFDQWLYGAGAPEYDAGYTYDAAAHQVKLTVKQTQKVEGAIGLFDMSTEVEIATASGHKTYPVRVSQATETFDFPADSEPLMVIFDKGDQILKTIDFEKTSSEWIYQLGNAETAPDRADAAMALGRLKAAPDVIAALGKAAQHDSFWGIRSEALIALGNLGGPDAERFVISAVNDDMPWVREEALQQLGRFTVDPAIISALNNSAANDSAYRVRAAALRSIGGIKAPNAFETLEAAVKTESPDNTLRDAALQALGALGDDRGVPALLEWSAPGTPFNTRQVAMGAVARLDKKNKKITQTLLSYLGEPHFDVNFWALFALGQRGDPDAIGPLEDLLKSGNLSMGEKPVVEEQLAILRAQPAAR